MTDKRNADASSGIAAVSIVRRYSLAKLRMYRASPTGPAEGLVGELPPGQHLRKPPLGRRKTTNGRIWATR
jgi:hypothetical protein